MDMSADVITISGRAHADKQIKGILTERAGNLQTELNGNMYTLNAHLLAPLEYADDLSIGCKVKSNGKTFIVMTKVYSPVDAAVACDLTLY